MKYCKKCVYPEVVINLSIDDDGICSSCRSFEEFENLPLFWKKRKERFDEIINQTLKNNKSNYDCIVPVSGGKDSYYQTHVMVSNYGLKPLLITYHGNNFLPSGDYNRDKMREFLMQIILFTAQV